MAEHDIDIKVQSTVDREAAKEAKEATRETNKQLRSVAGAAARISPEFAKLSKSFRAILSLTNSFGLSLETFTAYGAALKFGLILQNELNDMFENFANAIEETTKALQDMWQTVIDIKAKRMIEDGVTEDERSSAQSAKDVAAGNLRSLEDLYLKAQEAARKHGGGDTGAAYAIQELMKSGLYSDEDINEITKNGDVLGSLMNDLSKRIQETSKEVSTWDTVLRQYDKEQQTWLKGIVDNAKTMLEEGEREIDSMIQRKQNELDEDAEIDKEDAQSMTLLKNAPMQIQEAIRNAGKAAKAIDPSILVSRRDDNIRNQLNSLDRLGGYTSNLVNAQASPELQEMKAQTLKLNQIAENTKKTSARYSS